jgi:polyhydroxybutyrate depolymerase
MRATTRCLLAATIVLGVGCSATDAGDRSADQGPGPTGDGATSTTAVAADCRPARTAEGAGLEGGRVQTFPHDGADRQYLLALPDGYDGTDAAPLVLNFHGWSGTMDAHAANTGMAEAATARGYVAVTPQSLGDIPEWNLFGTETKADDYGFIDALVVDLAERLCIDDERVYAAGHSNGSAFSGFLSCQPPFRFAAVALVSAFVPTNCPDDVHPSVIGFAGTADTTVPYDGGAVGGGPIEIPSVPAVIARHAEHNGCGEPVEDEPAPGVRRTTLAGCADDGEVVLYTIVGGSHSWPGGATAEREPVELRAEGQLFPATDTILDFFDAH